ncbi:hypothetical protein V8F20_001686 [Naviculisporaceae sp. PSN 640]
MGFTALNTNLFLWAATLLAILFSSLTCSIPTAEPNSNFDITFPIPIDSPTGPDTAPAPALWGGKQFCGVSTFFLMPTEHHKDASLDDCRELMETFIADPYERYKGGCERTVPYDNAWNPCKFGIFLAHGCDDGGDAGNRDKNKHFMFGAGDALYAINVSISRLVSLGKEDQNIGQVGVTGIMDCWRMGDGDDRGQYQPPELMSVNWTLMSY